MELLFEFDPLWVDLMGQFYIAPEFIITTYRTAKNQGKQKSHHSLGVRNNYSRGLILKPVQDISAFIILMSDKKINHFY
jgi:hypothetical protein